MTDRVSNRSFPAPPPLCEVVDETRDYINLMLSARSSYEDGLGRTHFQKDYRIGGDVWQVHKYDRDPFPSTPHAHCIDGRQAYLGTKLHLGTRELFKGRSSIGLYLDVKSFDQLIIKIRPKFPGLVLPLPAGGAHGGGSLRGA